ncbi:hypothetical protein TKK_0013866 [Trichogramma kaykai]
MKWISDRGDASGAWWSSPGTAHRCSWRGRQGGKVDDHGRGGNSDCGDWSSSKLALLMMVVVGSVCVPRVFVALKTSTTGT